MMIPINMNHFSKNALKMTIATHLEIDSFIFLIIDISALFGVVLRKHLEKVFDMVPRDIV